MQISGFSAMLTLLLLAVVMSAAVSSKNPATPPHIVFILADDLGRGDVSTYGLSQIPTPNMDAIARAGIVLNNYYVQPVCTPSRASLMTGLYAIHTGLQHITLMPTEPSGLPLNFKILPEHLKDLGYETHCVGKWGIGFYTLNHTPTYRGFDSYYGTYSGPVDYYSHYLDWKGHRGIDLWKDTVLQTNETGRYLTSLFEEKAEYIIANRNKSKPLFLLLAHQAPHVSFGSPPMQAPTENIEKFFYIGDEKRTLHAAMVDALDESLGSLMEALEAASMLENTVIVFSSDNGASLHSLGGNWPLRGIKSTVWEGAVRVPGFIWSPRLAKSGVVSQQLMHITDWLPTLYSLAGGRQEHLGPIDGVDMWQALSTSSPSIRNEILLNIDNVGATTGFRYGDFKLVLGNNLMDRDQRHKIRGGSRPSDDLEVLLERSKANSVLKRFYGRKTPLNINDGSWRRNATIDCGDSRGANFALGEVYYVFDVVRDPCELHNLAHKRPALLYVLLAKLTLHHATAMPPLSRPSDPRAFPENNGGVWAPWIL